MKHIHRLSLAVITLFALMSVYGCGAEPPKPTPENLKANKALGVFEEMRKAYEARDMQGVLDRVSPDIENGYSDFAGRIRKDVEHFGRVELKVFVERVELAAGEVRVVFHWQGRWWDKDNKETAGRGNTVLSFADDEKMQLKKVSGDSPFGIVR